MSHFEGYMSSVPKMRQVRDAVVSSVLLYAMLYLLLLFFVCIVRGWGLKYRGKCWGNVLKNNKNF